MWSTWKCWNFSSSSSVSKRVNGCMTNMAWMQKCTWVRERVDVREEKAAPEILIIWRDEVEPGGKKWKCVRQVINCVRLLSERTATTMMMSIYWFFTFHFSSSLGTAAALDIIGRKRKSWKLKFFHSFKVLFVCAILVYREIEWKLWNNLDKLLFSSSCFCRLGNLKSLRNSSKEEWNAESGADVNDGTKTKKNEDSDERKRGKKYQIFMWYLINSNFTILLIYLRPREFRMRSRRGIEFETRDHWWCTVEKKKMLENNQF